MVTSRPSPSSTGQQWPPPPPRRPPPPPPPPPPRTLSGSSSSLNENASLRSFRPHSNTKHGNQRQQQQHQSRHSNNNHDQQQHKQKSSSQRSSQHTDQHSNPSQRYFKHKSSSSLSSLLREEIEISDDSLFDLTQRIQQQQQQSTSSDVDSLQDILFQIVDNNIHPQLVAQRLQEPPPPAPAVKTAPPANPTNASSNPNCRITRRSPRIIVGRRRTGRHHKRGYLNFGCSDEGVN